MLAFRKMHGLGNDFVILDYRHDPKDLSPAQVRAIADRQRGVGCDQLALLLPPTLPDADVFVRFFNNDGSEAGACGNATRCVARLLLNETGRDQAVIQTTAGRLPVWRQGTDAAGAPVYAVDLATPVFDWDKIPLAQPADTLKIGLTLGPLSEPSAVNVGNPHMIFFVADVESIDIRHWGPQAENHPLLPQKANIEFCQILAPNRIRMRVWERNTGVTQACGSGACAAVVAAARRGLLQRKAEVVLDGGVLHVEWRDDNRVIMAGTASASFVGTIEPEMLVA